MQMLVITSVAQEVVIVRIELHLKLFACLYEGIHIQPRLLCVYVVVRQTVY